MDMSTVLGLKWIIDRDLLCGTDSSTQSYGAA